LSADSREFIPVAHDLRGLVAAAVGFAELVRVRGDEEAAARLGEVLDRLRATLERVLSVVEADPEVARRLRQLPARDEGG
jgi:signal transduction histidine kinase